MFLERLERHCCEAEKYRAKLRYPAPRSLDEAARRADLRAWAALCRRLAAVEEPPPAPLLAVAEACARGEVQGFAEVCARLEAGVVAGLRPSLTRRAAGFLLDGGLVLALFGRMPALALVVWLVYDGGVRPLAGRSVGEWVARLPASRSARAWLVRAVCFALVAGALSLFVFPSSP